jgi:hypothetical protein
MLLFNVYSHNNQSWTGVTILMQYLFAKFTFFNIFKIYNSLNSNIFNPKAVADFTLCLGMIFENLKEYCKGLDQVK